MAQDSILCDGQVENLSHQKKAWSDRRPRAPLHPQRPRNPRSSSTLATDSDSDYTVSGDRKGEDPPHRWATVEPSDLITKRSIVCAARMRFAPETQPLREQAIDNIVKNYLVVRDTDQGVTVQELEQQGAECFPAASPAITRLDMQKSLDRLSYAGVVNPLGDGTDRRYRLSPEVFQDLRRSQKAAEALFRRIVDKLFANAPEGSAPYALPFLDSLCIIFSRLSEMYVRLLKGDVGHDEFLSSPKLVACLKQIKGKYPDINHSVLEAEVLSFFRERDAEYDLIKWNMAQNHYIALALGLDASGHLLSKELFGEATLYLDTNVVVNALEDKARHHRSFQALSRACAQLNIELKVCQISIDELRRVVYFHREVIPKVVAQIPDATAPRVGGIFFQLFRERLASGGEADLDELFSHFDQATDVLAKEYAVELIDDPWFGEAPEHLETLDLVRDINIEYQNRRGRPKGKNSALHDALLLRWIERERKQFNSRTWLATLDTSLPGFLPTAQDAPPRPLAVTLPALLQWISPIAVSPDVEEEVAAGFAEAIRYQLLRQEKLFELRDFLIFAEMDYQCKALPAEDVEECIRYLKAEAPGLDPSNPVDREKMAYVVNKFFADPGLKYKQQMARVDELEAELQQTEAVISKLEDEGANSRERALRESACRRLAVVCLVFVLLEAAIFYFANRYGVGENLFQKVVNSWKLFVLPPGASVVLIPFVLGKRRLEALGFPFTKLLKG